MTAPAQSRHIRCIETFLGCCRWGPTDDVTNRKVKPCPRPRFPLPVTPWRVACLQSLRTVYLRSLRTVTLQSLRIVTLQSLRTVTLQSLRTVTLRSLRTASLGQMDALSV